MKCKNCGTTIREGTSFCLSCGAQVKLSKSKGAQGGVKALIIVLVCSVALLSGVAAYAILSGRLGGAQNAPDAESGKSEAEASQDENVSEDIAEGNADSAQISENTTVTVVDVVGKAQENAAHFLEELGLNVTIVHSYSMRIPEGYVISQSVPGGEEIERGAKVTLAVSAGDHWSLEENEYGSGKVDLTLIDYILIDENESINLTISFLQTGEGEADVIFENKSDYLIFVCGYLYDVFHIYSVDENGKVYKANESSYVQLNPNKEERLTLSFTGTEGKITAIIIQNFYIYAYATTFDGSIIDTQEEFQHFNTLVIQSESDYTRVEEFWLPGERN